MENIREVIIFPKNQKYRDVMLNAPSEIEDDLLHSLGIDVVKKED
jgi:aspartyl-tRNA synthetase